jgi:hypothetical protein
MNSHFPNWYFVKIQNKQGCLEDEITLNSSEFYFVKNILKRSRKMWSCMFLKGFLVVAKEQKGGPR